MRATPSLLAGLGLSVGALAQSQSNYDYIILGGGTAGLAVAGKLSENPDVTVLVVEAGQNGTGVPWGYQSQPQVFVDGRVLELPSGKLVGGNSQINGKAYCRPDKSSIDDWGAVNDANWSWDVLFPFYKASESLTVPNTTQQNAGNTYNEEFHGFNGHVNTTYPAVGTPAFFSLLESGVENFGLPRNVDFNGGSARGLSTYPGTYRIEDGRTQIRESAREAYYLPATSRSNLVLLAETTALRIVWTQGAGGGTAVASGVEVVGADNKTQIISVNQEVILSAGAYRSAGILEYSGIGNPDILQQYNIDSVVDLPGVGENLQDQAQGTIFFEKSEDAGFSFPDPIGDEITTNYILHATYADIFGDKADSVRERVQSSLSSYSSIISNRINHTLSAEQILQSLQVQYTALFEKEIPAVEIFSNQALNNSVFGIEFWPLIPLGRGNVHISASDPQAGLPPLIDPNWFIVDYDWDIYIAAGRFVRQLFDSPPLSDVVSGEARPGLDALPFNASDDAWKEYFASRFRAGWHPIGTTAMLPRQWGGVVDGDLKVYGTANVRVVDAGVIPFQLGGHPTATIYALAERAARLIATGQKG